MPRLRTPFALFAVCGLAVTGCGGGEQGDPGVTTGGQTPTSARATAPQRTPRPQQGGGPLVTMRNIMFLPANVTVKKGQTVRWLNNDAVAHTVTATSGAEFDSGNLAPGKGYRYKPTKAGKISYYCTIHGKQQSGTITVK